jgi:hypothetical protein
MTGVENESALFKTFLEKYVPEGWRRLVRYPRVDGKKVDFGYRTPDTGHYYQNGMVIEPYGTGYRVETFTLENSKITTNFIAYYDSSHVLDMKEGFIDCFGLGIAPMEYEYMEEYWEAILSPDSSFKGWDEVSIASSNGTLDSQALKVKN